eukprot:TRINITY_DN15757_c0_g1_i1.p1 TRINITY_DN15757_c0_g1~~TRINITY_DN15757_c0_g1_i1.p1  ORF type:complete len:152 (+),score=14.88 TRINITY_DN15757_c0_g1_i1:64-519(+)
MKEKQLDVARSDPGAHRQTPSTHQAHRGPSPKKRTSNPAHAAEPSTAAFVALDLLRLAELRAAEIVIGLDITESFFEDEEGWLLTDLPVDCCDISPAGSHKKCSEATTMQPWVILPARGERKQHAHCSGPTLWSECFRCLRTRSPIWSCGC